MFRDIREQIDTIFSGRSAAKSTLEIILCYPGFHAIMLHRVAHKLYCMGLPLIPRMISQFSRILRESRSIPEQKSAAVFLSITEWVW